MKAITRKQRRLVKKYTDPDYSLLVERWNRLKRIIIFAIVILNVFLFCTGFVLLMIYNPMKRAYLYTKELFQEGNTERLLEIARTDYMRMPDGNYSRLFSIYALVDLENVEVAHILKDQLHELRFYSKMIQKPYRYPLEVLAIKLDYSTPEQLLSKLDSVKETQEDTIPITKVYFVKKITKGTKCMVSNQLLDIDEDDVVACPFCGNMSKQKLLSDWLETNKACLICQKTLTIDDCPLVIIRKK